MLAAVSALEEFLASQTAETLFYGIAVFGTVFFLGSLIFSAAGSEAGSAAEAEVDSPGDAHMHADGGDMLFKIFSVKSITAFLIFFGWSGVLFGETPNGLFAAVGVGIVMMFLTAWLLSLLFKLQDGGSRHGAYVGYTGVVYLTIPAERKESGIVTLTTMDGTRELRAVSDMELKTGTQVVVCEQLSPSLYIVKQA